MIEVDGIKVHCKYDELVSLDQIKPYTKNRNKHADDGTERLSMLMRKNGVRHAIVYDKRRDCIAFGHGRKLAAIRNGMDKYPVVYQEFGTDEEFHAETIADNAIADWSRLDYGEINVDLQDFGPNFNLDDLGIKNFTLDFNEKDLELKSFSETMNEHSDYFSYTLTVNKEHQEVFAELNKEKIIEMIVERSELLRGD